jgi:2-(1,2-epoxy-1,2-dihydrophenyl)acetyl-CoA isomerase
LCELVSELVEVKVQNHIGHIIMKRPEKLDALSRELVEDVVDALNQHSENPEVRAFRAN